MVGKFKIETPKIIFIDEFICLRSKAYLLKCGIDNKNKLKDFTKSKSKNLNLMSFTIVYLEEKIKENAKILL